MNILVTGAKGFIGKNLCYALKNLRDGNDRTRPNIQIDDINEFDIDCDPQLLDEFCKKADFVFNFAGINRPKVQSDFIKGNCGFVSSLIEKLKMYGNKCPVMLSSSIQASLEGRYAGGDYGKSKRDSEQLCFEYGEQSDVNVFVYRFPNVFGKWCKPNYNSAVATFCYNTANDLEVNINDKNTELELLYIDDLVSAMLDLLEGKVHRCDYNGIKLVANVAGRYCYVPTTYKATLGEIARLLRTFAEQPKTLVMPEMSNNLFVKKLYSTYLSYLPKEKIKYMPKTNINERGSFTELVKTLNCGQFSVNISKPGVTKGEHWHNTKWELFVVVSGKALIQERRIDSDDVVEFEVSGDKIEIVHMLPGYTHNIINLSQDEDLVTFMWANEIFDPQKPDTFCTKVVE